MEMWHDRCNEKTERKTQAEQRERESVTEEKGQEPSSELFIFTERKCQPL